MKSSTASRLNGTETLWISESSSKTCVWWRYIRVFDEMLMSQTRSQIYFLWAVSGDAVLFSTYVEFMRTIWIKYLACSLSGRAVQLKWSCICCAKRVHGHLFNWFVITEINFSLLSSIWYWLAICSKRIWFLVLVNCNAIWRKRRWLNYTNFCIGLKIRKIRCRTFLVYNS